MKKIAIGFSVAALALSGSAIAAHHEGRPRADSDGDGVVTRAESQAHAEAMFAKLDENNDGKLDQTDRDARRERMKAKMFDKLDADQDGSVSREEFMAFEGHRMGRHWGKGGMAGRREGGPGMDGPRKYHGMGMRGSDGMGMRGRHGMMMGADTDNDGALSQAEFLAAAGKRFDAVDSDSDGKITLEDRQKKRQERPDTWRDRPRD
jgi:hypothetical protein